MSANWGDAQTPETRSLESENLLTTTLVNLYKNRKKDNIYLHISQSKTWALSKPVQHLNPIHSWNSLPIRIQFKYPTNLLFMPTAPDPPHPALPRLDIDDMVLAQPEATDHKCDFDQFIVTGGSPLPAICGTNTGLHSKLTGSNWKSPSPNLCKVVPSRVLSTSQDISQHKAPLAWRVARRRRTPKLASDTKGRSPSLSWSADST